MATAKVDSNTAQVSELYQTMQENVFRGHKPEFANTRLTVHFHAGAIQVSVNKIVTFNGEKYHIRVNKNQQNHLDFIVKAYQLFTENDSSGNSTTHKRENELTSEMSNIAYKLMNKTITDQVSEMSSREVIIPVLGEVYATDYENEGPLAEKEVVTPSSMSRIKTWVKRHVFQHLSGGK